MTGTMQRRTTVLALRLAVALVLVTLLGTALALLIRKEQSLREILGYHTKIKTNLGLLRDNTRSLKQQLTTLKGQLGSGYQQRSREIQLFMRLDQIKTSLKPLDMNVSPIETKDGTASIGFTLKLPLASYETSVNTMGRLQTELFPFVIFKGTVIAASPGTDFSVEGAVVMPELTRTAQ